MSIRNNKSLERRLCVGRSRFKRIIKELRFDVYFED